MSELKEQIEELKNNDESGIEKYFAIIEILLKMAEEITELKNCIALLGEPQPNYTFKDVTDYKE